VNRLKDSEAESKIIILLTDGVNNAGQINPIDAAQLAKLNEYPSLYRSALAPSEKRAAQLGKWAIDSNTIGLKSKLMKKSSKKWQKQREDGTSEPQARTN